MAMGHLQETLPDTQAVICVSDVSAFGALTECQPRGIGVLGQSAIAGFGNYETADVAMLTRTTITPVPHDTGVRALRP
jgi:LacI family transcriptional regulator, gluconate utilization system Gnt-I transcriptional repressor